MNASLTDESAAALSALGPLFRARPGLTVAVAESLTAGWLQALLAAESGASGYFRGGVTAYALDVKIGLLGVDAGEVERTAGVSRRVAEEMARGACRLFDADLGLATTGWAEPSPADGVAAPFAWWALVDGRDRAAGGAWWVTLGRVEFPGRARVEVQRRVAETVARALADYLRG
jgi:nicotinamide-nucleotide amidase